MDNIISVIKDIETLGGVKKSFFYKENEIIGSSFPKVLSEKLINVGKMINLLFMGSKKVGSSYDEFCIFSEEMWLITYYIENDFIIGFLTDDEINIPLLNMTVGSYVPKIKKLSNGNNIKEKPEAVNYFPAVTNFSPADKMKIDKLEEEFERFLGPVGEFIFEECVEKWQNSRDNKKKNLVLMLAKEINNSKERTAFVKNAQVIVET